MFSTIVTFLAPAGSRAMTGAADDTGQAAISAAKDAEYLH